LAVRELVFDTYYGEGRVDQGNQNFPGFRHWYMKVSDGEFGYIGSGKQPYDAVTRHNFMTAKNRRDQGDLDTLAAYHFARRQDEGFHWQDQADAYLRQVDWLDAQGVVLDYDVLDLEPKGNNIPEHPSWGYKQFPRGWGSWMWEWYKYVTAHTGRLCLLYGGSSHAYDMFDRWGYEWHRECDWIISSYPLRQGDWNQQFHDEILAGLHEMPLFRQFEYMRNKVVMWQYSDMFPVTGWQLDEEGGIGSRAADVNVWLVDWRVLLNKPLPEVPKVSPVTRAWNRIKDWRIRPL